MLAGCDGALPPAPDAPPRLSLRWLGETRVPHRLDGSALEALTGPLPRTPLDRALVQALDGYRQQRRQAA